jgi:hypothetical protein
MDAYNFYWYSPNSGDYYYGTVYDDGTYGYFTGQTYYDGSLSTESGSADGYYYIYSSSNATGSGYSAGQVTGTSAYWDAQSGSSLTTWYGSSTVAGSSGLGSEYNWASTSTGWDYFGNDYYEANYA